MSDAITETGNSPPPIISGILNFKYLQVDLSVPLTPN